MALGPMVGGHGTGSHEPCHDHQVSTNTPLSVSERGWG